MAHMKTTYLTIFLHLNISNLFLSLQFSFFKKGQKYLNYLKLFNSIKRYIFIS